MKDYLIAWMAIKGRVACNGAIVVKAHSVFEAKGAVRAILDEEMPNASVCIIESDQKPVMYNNVGVIA